MKLVTNIPTSSNLEGATLTTSGTTSNSLNFSIIEHVEIETFNKQKNENAKKIFILILFELNWI